MKIIIYGFLIEILKKEKNVIILQIDAMETILHDSDTENSASTLSATVVQSPAKPRTRREPPKPRRNIADVEHAIAQIGERRYLQVYAQCYCQMNRLSSVRKRGSCYAAYKVGNCWTMWERENFLQGRVSFTYQSGQELHVFYPAKCLCQLDWVAKALWPCFPCKFGKRQELKKKIENGIFIFFSSYFSNFVR